MTERARTVDSAIPYLTKQAMSMMGVDAASYELMTFSKRKAIFDLTKSKSNDKRAQLRVTQRQFSENI